MNSFGFPPAGAEWHASRYFGDIEDAKAIANNPSSASWSKHIDVKLHFIRGLVRAGEVRVLHVGTAEKHADVLTKPLWRKSSCCTARL